MALKLNQSEKYVVYPAEGTAPNTEQMPLLIADSRVPLNMSEAMDARLDFIGTDTQDSWYGNYFDLGDALFYNPNGNVKVILDAQVLRELNPKSRLDNGALVLEDSMYESFEGVEFTRDDLQKAITGKALTRKQAKSHPVWQTLARNQARLDKYVDATFDLAKEKFSYDQNMGLYISNIPKKDNARLWCLSWLNDRSSAYAWYGLDYSSGRLVGVEKSAVGTAKNLDSDKVIQYTTRESEEAISELRRAEEFFRPEAFAKTKSLLTRLQ